MLLITTMMKTDGLKKALYAMIDLHFNPLEFLNEPIEVAEIMPSLTSSTPATSCDIASTAPCQPQMSTPATSIQTIPCQPQISTPATSCIIDDIASTASSIPCQPQIMWCEVIDSINSNLYLEH